MSCDSDERAVAAGLAALREAAARESAPEVLEAKMAAAFRAHHASARKRSRWLMPAAAAAAVAAVFAAKAVYTPVVEAPQAPVQVVREQPRVEVPKPVEVASAPRPVRRAAPAIRRRTPAPQREVATDFLPLPYAPPMAATDEAAVYRVRLPRSSLRSFGLPVDEERAFERVQADVVMGQDGIARAIRFVH